jgi:SAM-dependent methyltransferase
MTEQDRIIDEYRARAKRGAGSVYHPMLLATQIAGHSLERAVHRCFRRANIHSLKDISLLDVGCGEGGQLLRWIQWGATPGNCSGVDLLQDRLVHARERLPTGISLLQADASHMPFSDSVFEVTSQFTVLSSILDDEMQRNVACEMLRVTAPDGIILSYDFWLNPRNPATRGVRLGHLRRLFPGCKMYVQRITLAPPICRRLAPFSPVACRLLEAMRIFNSHYLAMIQRRTPGSR